MIDQTRRRRTIQQGRSQLATELLLLCFSAIAAVILLRTMLVILDISDRVWIGEFVFGLTGPVTNVIGRLPGAQREIWNSLTTIDFTLLALLPLFMLGLVASARDMR